MGSITIIQPGMYSSIQDSGREGYAHLGVPVSGAMDKKALDIGNKLVNNPSGSAALECTLVGAKIRFDCDRHFVVTGLAATITLDGDAVRVGETAFAKANQILHIKEIKCGARVYLCIAGGIATEKVLGSRSYYAPLTPRVVTTGQKLPLGISQYDEIESVSSEAFYLGDNKLTTAIPVYRGPEWENLPKIEKAFIKSSQFTLSDKWSRMAIQLVEKVDNSLSSIRSAPVLPGTVQLTPDGTMIILCNDCQITGGYPRVLQLSTGGLQLLSQIRPGESIDFKFIGLQDYGTQ